MNSQPLVADLVPGTYIAEWEVTYPGGVVVTYPTTGYGYIDVKIYDDLST